MSFKHLHCYLSTDELTSALAEFDRRIPPATFLATSWSKPCKQALTDSEDEARLIRDWCRSSIENQDALMDLLFMFRVILHHAGESVFSDSLTFFVELYEQATSRNYEQWREMNGYNMIL
jgi:hypothetical protein